MHKLNLFLLLSLMLPYAFGSENSPQVITPQTAPLTDEEKQDNLRLLNELGECRVKNRLCEDLIRNATELKALLKEVYETRIEQEKQNTALALKDRDLALERAKMYEELYIAARHKKPGRSFGCWMKKIFSFWLWRC